MTAFRNSVNNMKSRKEVINVRMLQKKKCDCCGAIFVNEQMMLGDWVDILSVLMGSNGNRLKGVQERKEETVLEATRW